MSAIMTANGKEPSGASRVAILLIFAIGLVLRLVYFVQSGSNPLLYLPVLDEAYYIDFGRTVAGGFWLGENRAFFMDPLYGYLLGLVFMVFGDDLTYIRLIQVLLDSFNVILIYALGMKVWNRDAALIAALLYAVYKVSFYYTLLILKTTGTITLCLLFTLALVNTAENGKMRNWFFLGVFAGVLTCFRGNLLLIAPFGLMAYWHIKKPGHKTLALNMALTLIGLALALTPGAIRNHHVTGQWTMLNTQAGRLFYLSNNPENLTGRYNVPSFSRPDPEDSEEDFHREAERRLGKRLNANQVSSYWKRLALGYLVDNPGDFATIMANKLKGTVGDYEIPNNHSVYLAARFSNLARWPLPTFAFAFSFGVIGLALGAARDRKTAWLLVPLFTTLSTVLIFYTSSRFRMPSVPFLLIGSGVFFCVVREYAAKRDFARGAASVATALALVTICYSVPHPAKTGNEEHSLARAFWNVNALEPARQIASRAAATHPAQSRFQVLLGIIALSEKRYDESIRHNLRAIKINPADANAYHNLGLSYMANEKYEDAIVSLETAFSLGHRPESLFALARACEMAGFEKRAVALYKKYLKISKPSAPLRQRAGDRLKELGR